MDINNPLSSSFSPQQRLAQSLLGYQRWLPQEAVRAYHASQAAYSETEPEHAPTTSQKSLLSELAQSLAEPEDNKNNHKNQTELKNEAPESGSGRAIFSAENDPTLSFSAAPSSISSHAKILTLPNSGAQIAICRDYALLFATKWACDWLLPPLWTREEKLQCFALPIEQKLWLAALQAVGFKDIATAFAELFITDMPIVDIPVFPLETLLAERKKSVVLCGEIAGLDVPETYILQRLLHPIVLLNTQTRKRELWQQLLTLKEKIF